MKAFRVKRTGHVDVLANTQEEAITVGSKYLVERSQADEISTFSVEKLPDVPGDVIYASQFEKEVDQR